MELLEIEKYLKQKYFELGPSYNLEDFKNDFSEDGDMFEYTNLYSLLLRNSIDSSNFFEGDHPIEVFRHLRYLPAKEHSNDHFEVIYVFSGQVKATINNEEMSMKDGDICILSPNTSHSISSFSDEVIVYNILIKSEIFESQFIDFASNTNNILSNFFSLSLLKNVNAYIFFDTNNDSHLKEYIKYIVKEHTSERKYRKEMINNLVSALFILLLRYHEEHSFSSSLVTDIKNQKNLDIIKHIQNNYSDVTLTSLSEMFSYSERQISRIVRTFTNYSFGKFVTNIKLEKAMNLLQSTNMSIDAIAESVGYEDSSAFFRQFKKNFGSTPATYRKLK
ncbi:hypothetical protein BAU15_07490 [Enterococcus sp. JM4C]|uniref:AraC family transcriptional regulator n=1 Tax=Candidatus Enterococcus huntleyi TaxID=1857217 RepID=UPI00137AEF6B|nr:helix-turn-helix domain-containing protein [Enterococcus sp. JM4C]KAF1297547.1 hypothetical protein BAU15_07490 [Enterococcus sp. JM4C]